MSKLSAIIKLNKTQYNTLKAGGSVGTYTWDDNALYIVEDSTEYVPTTRTINGLPLSNNIVLTGRNIIYDTSGSDTIYAAVTEKTKYAGQLEDAGKYPETTLRYSSSLNGSDAFAAVSGKAALMMVQGPGAGLNNYIGLTGNTFKDCARSIAFSTSASGSSVSSILVGNYNTSKQTNIYLKESLKDGDHILLLFNGGAASASFPYNRCAIEAYIVDKTLNGTKYTMLHQVGGKAYLTPEVSGDPGKASLACYLSGTYYTGSGIITVEYKVEESFQSPSAMHTVYLTNIYRLP